MCVVGLWLGLELDLLLVKVHETRERVHSARISC